MAFNQDIVKRSKANTYFREVLATGPHSQVVVMSIPPGGDIGEEVHDDVDQTLVFVQGNGEASWTARRARSRSIDLSTSLPGHATTS
jgi:mannose-6-phosphate isomerase-like protein (cupin superfamily)